MPKTAAGFRTVPLSGKAMDALKKMEDVRGAAPGASAVEDGMCPEELIFKGPKSGHRTKKGRIFDGAMNRNNFRRLWIPAIKAAGIARMVINPETGRKEWWPGVHDYRHALASRLHAQEVPEVDVQLFLGQERGVRAALGGGPRLGAVS